MFEPLFCWMLPGNEVKFRSDILSFSEATLFS